MSILKTIRKALYSGSYGPGSWFGLPEFGFTEGLGGKTTSVIKAIEMKPYLMSAIEGDMGNVSQNISPQYTNKQSQNQTQVQQPVQTKTTAGQQAGESNSEGGYSAREIFRRLGLDYSQKSALYKKYGVNNAVDLERKILAERERAALEGETSPLRKLIEDRYQSYLDFIERARGEVPERRQSDLGFLETQYSNMAGSLQRGRELAEQNLLRQKQQGLRELAERFRAGAEAANTLIGAAGGGNSSAVGMASYALQKQAARLGNELQREQMARQAEIDNVYQTELANLNEWYAQNQKAVVDYYNQYLDRLEEMKQTAGDVRYEALSNLQEYIIDRAQQRLEQLRQEALARRQQLENWALERLAALNNARIEMTQATFNPYDIVGEELGSVNFAGTDTGDYGYNPYLILRRPRARSMVY